MDSNYLHRSVEFKSVDSNYPICPHLKVKTRELAWMLCVSRECAGLSWDHEKILNFWVVWSRSPIAKINMTWTSQEVWGVLSWNILKQKSPKWMMRYGLEPWASRSFFGEFNDGRRLSHIWKSWLIHSETSQKQGLGSLNARLPPDLGGGSVSS